MNICVIGGDSRIVELVGILKEKGNCIVLYGLEKSEKLKDYNHVQDMKSAVQNADYVITSIPLSKDGKIVNTAFSDETIQVEEFLKVTKNKKVVTGNVTNEIKRYMNSESNNLIDVLQFEELTILNAIPTAEGAIQIAMEKSLITLHNSKCLVLGFGRIGKILSKMLSGIGAKVYCEARKKQDIAWIKAYGYNPIELEKLDNYLGEFDFIFNTIPYVVLNSQNLNLIKKDCLIIDLASKPGGIDFDEAKRLDLQTEWALALPGKVAPKTAATYIFEIINKLQELENAYNFPVS